MGIVVLVVASILLGFLLIVLAGRSGAGRQPAEAASSQEKDAGILALEGLDLPRFERLCVRLLEELGLVINAQVQRGEREVEISAVNPQPVIGGDFLILCVLSPDGHPVDAASVIALSDAVRAERAAKGILITNGYFSEEATKVGEGAPVECINARRFRELLESHRILPA